MINAAYLINCHLQAVDLKPAPWYHGPITRAAANALLTPMEDGLFLIRESSHYPGNYTLSLCNHNKVEHFHISYEEVVHSENRKKLYTVDGLVFFDSLYDLVDHYSADRDGLPCKLTQVLPKKGIPCFPPVLELFRSKGWLLPQEQLQMMEKIGSGEFCDVHRATFNGKFVAAKCIPQTGEQSLLGANEAAVLTDLHHENVVAFFGFVVGRKELFLLCEFMEIGALVTFLRTRGKQAIVLSQLVAFILDIAAALKYLADKKYVHRDIAARNVLLTADQLTAKLSDFGLCQREGATYHFGKVPVKWTAPEAIRHSQFSLASDVWSFGILCWEIFSFGKLPYHGVSVNDILAELEDGLRLPMPADCPPVFYRIMCLCWRMEPLKRPSAAGLLETCIKLKQFCLLKENALESA